MMEGHTCQNFRTSFHFPSSRQENIINIGKDGGIRLQMVLNGEAKEIFNDHKALELKDTIKQVIAALIYRHRSDV